MPVSRRRAIGSRSSAATLLVALAIAAPAGAQAPAAAPPIARVIPKVDTMNGDVRVDNYYWMRDRKNPETIKYLEAENAYTAAMTKHMEKAQERLYQEMLGRIKETDLSVPYKRDGYWYYTKTEAGKQYPIFARKRGTLSAAEEIILDQNELAKGKEFLTVTAVEPSPDAQRLAFIVDTTGHEDFTLMVKDLRTGAVLPDRLSHVSWGVAWSTDGNTVFYTTEDSAKRTDKVWRHALGTPQKRDAMIYHDPDVLFNVRVAQSKSGEYVFVASEAFNASEWHVVSARRPASPLRTIAPRRKGLEYSVVQQGDRLLIVTNDSAQNFRLVAAPASDPSPKNWRPVPTPGGSGLLDGIEEFRDHLALFWRDSAKVRIQIVNTKTGDAHFVPFEGDVYSVGPSTNADYDSPFLRYSYTSFVTPSRVYDYDFTTRKATLKKETEVPSGFDASKYKMERTWARARDGKMVPVSLVYKTPFVRDGSRPLLLYSYGSYGSSSSPAFNPILPSYLDRGIVYAIAHIRGGQEMGRAWYDDGKLLNKKNTFNDFVDAAEHLVREKYTSPSKLVVNGGSAGGLLMGAVVNMRPDLFKAVVAEVPFVDVINTMLDASIPLTAQEWEQWGNPADPKYYAYMKSYSPYDNVERKAYPEILITSGLNDSRVAYWEPSKWTAKLRAMKTDGNRLLLKMNMGAGHGGSSGRYDRLKEQAFKVAFILDALGLLSSVDAIS
jgi:oligopeptidase B